MTFSIGTPRSRGAGYYINNIKSARPQEADILTCVHCQSILPLKSWQSKGGFCRRCFAPVCIECSRRMATYGCENFLRQLEKETDAIVKYNQYLKVAGLESSASPLIKGT